MFTSTERWCLSGLSMASSAVMRSGREAKLSILIYHRVLPRLDPMREGEPDVSEFNRQMGLLARYYSVLPMAEALVRLKSAQLPRRAACVTFDDGYADNVEVALPILKRWRIPATFFISTAFLGGGCMWNDAVIETLRNTASPELDLNPIGLGCYPLETLDQRRQAVRGLLATLKYLAPDEREQSISYIVNAAGVELPDHLMMTVNQLKELSDSGMEIGGHTVSHPILNSVDDKQAYNEIAEGKEELASITRAPIRFFAYPNGKPGKDYDRQHIKMVRSLGFNAAVSTAWGAVTQDMDLYQMPRFTPWDRSPGRFMLRLMRNSLKRKVDIL